jgi:hypothetical protein
MKTTNNTYLSILLYVILLIVLIGTFLAIAGCDIVESERPLVVIENVSEVFSPGATTIGFGEVVQPSFDKGLYYDFKDNELIVHKNGELMYSNTYTSTEIVGDTRIFYK